MNRKSRPALGLNRGILRPNAVCRRGVEARIHVKRRVVLDKNLAEHRDIPHAGHVSEARWHAAAAWKYLPEKSKLFPRDGCV